MLMTALESWGQRDVHGDTVHSPVSLLIRQQLLYSFAYTMILATLNMSTCSEKYTPGSYRLPRTTSLEHKHPKSVWTKMPFVVLKFIFINFCIIQADFNLNNKL